MSTNPDDITRAALGLSDDERGRLALLLLESLEPEGPELSQEEIDDAWAEEIGRRVDEVRAGTARLVPAEEAIARARERLKSRR